MENIINFFKKNNSKVFIFILLIFFSFFFYRIYTYRSEYFSKFDQNYWKERYLNSQWFSVLDCASDPHINPKTCIWDDAWYEAYGKENLVNSKNTPKKEIISIGDDGLYAYSGWEYVTNGKDPTLLNAEIPPFGKYLIGLSILIFGNQNIFALFSGILVLFAFFLLNLEITKNKTIASLPVFLFSLEPLFYTQLRAPFLDLLYLSMLIFSFYFLLKKKILFSMIFLGLMMATKASFATFFTVSFAMVIYFSLCRNFQSLKKILFFLPIAVLIFTSTYLRYFFLGHNLREFLGVQKWILLFYYNGAKASFGNAWQMLISGKWETWWGSTIRVDEWQITWPLIFLFSLLSLFLLYKKKKIEKSFIFLIWVFIYLLFLSTLPVFPRYLLLIIPFLYSLSVSNLYALISKNHLPK